MKSRTTLLFAIAMVFFLGVAGYSTEQNDRKERNHKSEYADIVGNYAFSYSKQEATFVLAVRVNNDGKLTAHWRTGDDKVPSTDLNYEEGVLTFKSKLGSYKGGLTKTKSLNGTYTTADGREFSVLSHRLGTAVIGIWDLKVRSEQGVRKQSLKVNSDMTGRYGDIPIKEVHLRGDSPLHPKRPRTVTFKAVMKTAERTVEITFSGTVSDSKLTGELKTPGGTLNVTGKKRAVPVSKHDTP